MKNVKQLHALIDELFDAGQVEALTALGTIMMALGKSADAEGDLDLDDEKPAKKVRGGRKAKAVEEDDEEVELDGDEDGEDDDEDELGDLDVDLDDEDEDEKPAKKVRGGKKTPAKAEKPVRGRKAKVVEDDEDEDGGDMPALEVSTAKKAGKEFDAFLDEVDEFEFEQEAGGVRELTKTIRDFGINPDDMDFGFDEDLAGRDLRKAKEAAYGQLVSKLQHISSELCNLDEDMLAAVADHLEVDHESIKGRGKAKTVKIAAAIIEAVYGPEEDEE